MNKEINVILVDKNDRMLGLMEKMEAHQKGLLHRAISVFLFNGKGEWLLQKRAESKYHCGGLWSNTCCTHPLHGESYEQAAIRRLSQEMGICTPLKKEMSFIYRAEVNNNLTEHELDTVFIGSTDSIPNPDPKEVSEFRYISGENLDKEILEHPEHFTPWFLKIYSIIKSHLRETTLEKKDAAILH